MPTVMVSYGSAARSALHVVKTGGLRGSAGAARAADLWPFPKEIVRKNAPMPEAWWWWRLNMGQVDAGGQNGGGRAGEGFLANRIDGVFITPMDIRNILRLIQGKGV
jgi:2-oxoglutarate ferredoxin oxidoreductase subunit alpha